MVSFNKVIMVGNLTKNPEIRYIPSGTPVASFRIAVNHRYKQGDELKDDVTFIDIVVFGKQAESCGQYLNKGDGVLVEGRLQERRWEGENGQKRSKYEIVAQNIRFMPKGRGTSDVGSGEGEATSSTQNGELSDVPF